jgi:hypothetical protein
MTSSSFPKISFGIIVFNGEPFTKYCLRALYPFAHEIIVAEGACPGAAPLATADGHSTDGTLENLYRFQQEEDPEKKVHVITRKGFWSEKDEQSRAYAERATGDYLWQIDIDEFYQPEDMKRVLDMLRQDSDITAVSFQQVTFWGGFDYTADSWYLRSGADVCFRIFRWGPSFQYITHRPPTIQDAHGRDVRKIKWIDGKALARMGIIFYHYSLVFPKQVEEKCEYHSGRDVARYWEGPSWAKECFHQLSRPYRVHNVYTHPSWLEHFKGVHPPQIEALRRDLKSGVIPMKMRRTDDVEILLHSFRYRCGRLLLKMAFPFWRRLSRPWNQFLWIVTHPLKIASGIKRRALRLFARLV